MFSGQGANFECFYLVITFRVFVVASLGRIGQAVIHVLYIIEDSVLEPLCRLQKRECILETDDDDSDFLQSERKKMTPNDTTCNST
jgi:hypothetical protein